VVQLQFLQTGVDSNNIIKQHAPVIRDSIIQQIKFLDAWVSLNVIYYGRQTLIFAVKFPQSSQNLKTLLIKRVCIAYPRESQKFLSIIYGPFPRKGGSSSHDLDPQLLFSLFTQTFYMTPSDLTYIFYVTSHIFFYIYPKFS